MIEGVAEGIVLRLVPATAEPEDEAPVADLIQRVRHLGEQGRVAERRAGDERADLDLRGDRRDRAQEGEDLPAAALVLFRVAIDEVIGEPEGVEADLLGRLRHRLNVCVPWRLAAQRTLTERGHHTEFHLPPRRAIRHCRLHSWFRSIRGDHRTRRRKTDDGAWDFTTKTPRTRRTPRENKNIPLVSLVLLVSWWFAFICCPLHRCRRASDRRRAPTRGRGGRTPAAGRG